MTDLQPLLQGSLNDLHPIIIAGPCSAETEEQVLATAKDLAKNGIKIFRAGIWKPRTKPGGFEGVGAEAYCNGSVASKKRPECLPRPRSPRDSTWKRLLRQE